MQRIFLMHRDIYLTMSQLRSRGTHLRLFKYVYNILIQYNII